MCWNLPRFWDLAILKNVPKPAMFVSCKDRTGQDRTGQDRTGQDRIG